MDDLKNMRDRFAFLGGWSFASDSDVGDNAYEFTNCHSFVDANMMRSCKVQAVKDLTKSDTTSTLQTEFGG